MSLHSKIEWTRATFNPWWGCTKVSPGCDHCYAEREALRYGHQVWGKDAPRRVMSAKYWEQPLAWNRKAEASGERWRVFCGSHCDVMEEGVYLEGIRERQLYPLIEATPWLDWLLLTKRPQNFRRFLPAAWLENPLPNVIGMTTVENAEYLWRINYLLGTPFATRALSAEADAPAEASPNPRAARGESRKGRGMNGARVLPDHMLQKIAELGLPPSHTVKQYLAYDPGAGDDFPAEVECRKTALVVTRREHTCFGVASGGQHIIPAGTRAYRETGKCEGKFGTVYMCLPCVDIALEPEWW